MEQTNEDLTTTFKWENESNEMDIKGTVIKLELETPMTLIQKPNVGLENSNQMDHIEVHSENQEILRKPKNVYEQSFRCVICEKYFKLKSQMQRHVKKVHEKASETKCELEFLEF